MGRSSPHAHSNHVRADRRRPESREQLPIPAKGSPATIRKAHHRKQPHKIRTPPAFLHHAPMDPITAHKPSTIVVGALHPCARHSKMPTKKSGEVPPEFAWVK